MPRGDAPELSEETITVTGQLYFEDRMHPELKSGAEEYELLVPRFYAYELELEEGQTVTIEGYTLEGMPCCREEEEQEIHILVTKAIIDGQEYNLEDDPRWGMMGPGMGRRGGMMGPGRRPYGYYDDRDWGRRM
jgi:RNase P/RNase MRP subunit p29